MHRADASQSFSAAAAIICSLIETSQSSSIPLLFIFSGYRAQTQAILSSATPTPFLLPIILHLSSYWHLFSDHFLKISLTRRLSNLINTHTYRCMYFRILRLHICNSFGEIRNENSWSGGDSDLKCSLNRPYQSFTLYSTHNISETSINKWHKKRMRKI